MKKAPALLSFSLLALLPAYAGVKPQPGVKIATGYSAKDVWFKFDDVPSIAISDAATQGKFTIVSGDADGAGAGVAALNDDEGPTKDDSPEENFFFAGAGRLELDLGKPIDVKAVASYSWHTGGRAPQIYKLYAAKGDEAGFNKAPKDVDPTTCGWKYLGAVDTRPESGPGGGQHGVQFSAENGGSLGNYQHLLFDIAEGREATFFSEIDVIDANAPEPKRISKQDEVVKKYDSADGKYHFILDSTKATDLTDWSEKELIPIVKEWYPKLVALLPSDDFKAPDTIHLRYLRKMEDGTPAYMTPDGVSLNAPWFRGEQKGEGPGAVIHELVHVVQSYELAEKTNPEPKETPSWVTEGIADYIRWFIYEPQSKGAEISKEDAAKVKYDDSYRTTANFMDYVNRTYGGNVVKDINTAAREGKYSARLWKKLTGKKVEELAEEWKAALQK